MRNRILKPLGAMVWVLAAMWGSALSAQASKVVLSNNGASMDFGTFVIDSTQAGSIFMDPATGGITSSNWTAVASTTSAGAVLATETAGTTRTFNLQNGPNIAMTGTPSGFFTLSQAPLQSSLPGDAWTLNGFGTKAFTIGGAINIPAASPAGDYNGILAISAIDDKNRTTNTVSIPVHIRLVAPISLLKVQDLDMGTVIPGATGGTVTLNPSTGAQGVSGGVLYASPTAQPAQFRAGGGPNATFNIQVNPATVSLTGPAGTLSLALAASPSGSSTFNSASTATINVGGTLSVPPNQTDGDYTGTFTVTVAYP